MLLLICSLLVLIKLINYDGECHNGISDSVSGINDLDFRKDYLIILSLCLLPWPLIAAGIYLESNMWVTFFFYHWLLLFPFAIWKRSYWSGDIKFPSLKVIALVLLAAVLTGFLALCIYDASGKLIVDAGAVKTVLMRLKYDENLLVPLIVYFVIVNPFLEEIFWRGSVQNLVLEHFENRPLLGLSFTAIAFGAWHYLVLRVLLEPGASELFVFGVVLVGFLLGFIYRKTSNLMVSVLVHSLVFDLSVVLILLKVVL